MSDLLPAAHEVAQQLLDTRTALDQAVARQTAQLSMEKDRLERLLSDVPVGLMLCSAEHQVVFYNGQIVSLLGGWIPALPRGSTGVFSITCTPRRLNTPMRG
ncbi:hypothetical protein [Neopusillimonas aromaticivorans]|uniref:hypothetical protein n=1 Tax=Neopusillimonas aromaticivorans TaxID=2979868 RepID=UPI002594E5C8|nr:hypothetical protein [Neopusillimonas aromaticivorans]WJJ94334.1 hypothetical protein N7E01_04695 [Neopusillimonas aromaticivorans]